MQKDFDTIFYPWRRYLIDYLRYLPYDNHETRIKKGDRHGNRKEAKERQKSKRTYPGSTRRKHPVINMSEEVIHEIESRKKRAGAGILFLASGAVGLVITISLI